MSSRHRNLEPLGRWHATMYTHVQSTCTGKTHNDRTTEFLRVYQLNVNSFIWMTLFLNTANRLHWGDFTHTPADYRQNDKTLNSLTGNDQSLWESSGTDRQTQKNTARRTDKMDEQVLPSALSSSLCGG